MKPRELLYYDWVDDIKPAIIQHMGIDSEQFYVWRRLPDPDLTNPMTHTRIFRNYWNLFIELWGKNIVIGSHIPIRFADPDNDTEWQQLYDHAFIYGEWATAIVSGVREMVRENDFGNKDVVIHFTSWI